MSEVLEKGSGKKAEVASEEVMQASKRQQRKQAVNYQQLEMFKILKFY
jgi:hypothetical protein